MKKRAMTRKHKDWDNFCALLEGKEGCNFRYVGKNKKIVWSCKGGEDKTYAKKILKKYFPDIDIKKTFKYFEKRGGFCDCEILFNIVEP